MVFHIRSWSISDENQLKLSNWWIYDYIINIDTQCLFDGASQPSLYFHALECLRAILGYSQREIQ